MNKRLLAYLRSIGLAADATDDQATEFFHSLRGLKSTIANALNYQEDDFAARTNCDLVIRALGFNPENPTEQQSAEPAPTRSQPGDDGASTGGDLEAARREAIAQERARVAEIREYGELARVSTETIERHISEGTSAANAREAFLREYREQHRASVPADTGVAGGAPAGHSRNSQTGFDRQSLEFAMLHRFGGQSDPLVRHFEHNQANGFGRFVDRQSDGETARACDRGYELSGLSLVNMCQRALAVDGIRCEPTVQGVMEASRSLATRGAVSTSAFVGMFTQTFGAQLLSAFLETADTTAGWTVERDNPNFFSIPRTRPVKGGALTKHAKGGKADHMDFSDVTENTKVNRYSGQFAIDEMDLINDYFGAMADFTPSEMGAAARRLRPDLVYYILIANPNMRDSVALFHTGSHGNLATGAALAKATLQAGITAIVTQQENGVNLNLMPKYLIVPPTLAFTARELVRGAQVVVAGGTDTVIPSKNALVDYGLQVVEDSRLENGVTDPDSGSTAAGANNDWYLSAPGSRHTIEVTYLRGSSRSPEMRSELLTQGQWGINFDVKADIGAKALAWEGLYKGEG